MRMLRTKTEVFGTLISSTSVSGGDSAMTLGCTDSAAPKQILLLGRFAALADLEELDVPEVCQKLLAIAALTPGPTSRERLLRTFWPDEPHKQAASRLRSALSRLRRVVPWLRATRHGLLTLDDTVNVDYRRAVSVGRRLTEAPDSRIPTNPDIRCFDKALLPDWYDEWLRPERQAFEQLRFASLEVIAARSIDAGQMPVAIQASLAVIRDEPLRESAHRLLVRAHAADGNLSEALRQVESYEQLLRSELGLEPSRLMLDLRSSIVSST